MTALEKTVAEYGPHTLQPGKSRMNEVFPDYAARHNDIPTLAVEKYLLIYLYLLQQIPRETHQDRVTENDEGRFLRRDFHEIQQRFDTKGQSQEPAHHQDQESPLPKDTPLSDASLWFDPATCLF